MRSLTIAPSTLLIDFLDKNARFHPVVSAIGMVVSQEAIASQVGADILEAGGNAIDAAVATDGFALAVTLPRAGNLGRRRLYAGAHLAKENKTIAIDLYVRNGAKFDASQGYVPGR